MTHVLSDFCAIKLGYKSLMNDFFYLDAETIDRFKIEDEFLVPIYMLADLDESKFLQKPVPKRWVFTCTKLEPDLRGSGAWSYIDWGAHQVIVARKQAKEPTTFKSALEKQGGREWWFPKAVPHPSSLAVRKGINDRYAPFVFEDPVVIDQRLYLFFPKATTTLKAVEAFAVSSLFPLTLETNADLGLGAGVLTLSTEGLRQLPCPDLGAIQQSTVWKNIEEQTKKVLHAPTPTASSMASDVNLQALDALLLEAMGIDPARSAEPSKAAAELALIRIDRSKQRMIVKADASAADIKRTSEPVVQELEAWLAGRAFPKDYLNEDEAVRHFNFPNGPLGLELTYFLGRLEVQVFNGSGDIFFTDEMSEYAGELILRCLQFGLRTFDLPNDEDKSYRLLGVQAQLTNEFEKTFQTAIRRTSLGSLYENTLGGLVLSKLKIDLVGLKRPLHSSGGWHIS